jgi:hypothetical protein
LAKKDQQPFYNQTASSALCPLHPLKKKLEVGSWKLEVGRVKREGDEHTDWPMANVTIARGIAPEKLSDFRGLSESRMTVPG